MPKKGYNPTIEHRNNLKGAMKGNKNALGWKMIDKQKEALRNRNKKMGISPPHGFGENSSNWKDGRNRNKEWVSWVKNKRNRTKRGAVGGHTFGEWELLKKQYGYVCPCCGKSEPEIILTEDHIVPLSKGGSDYIENIQPLCRGCNCKKFTKITKY